ncbi:MAG: tail fiber domain-containing protein [Chloracidobacterium sp.]|nr:tail fiber domain-containing protein [Chloracidobacterium sp.]
MGTRFVDGLAASGYVLNSAVNADVRFAFSAGHISDEDLRITIAAQTEPAQIPVFSRAGVGGLWKRATATDYPYLTTGTGRIAYNLDTAGTWSQAEVSNGDFCAYWIFATDGKNFPIISIQGQRQDTSLANAQNNNLYESLAFGTLPYAEMKLLYRVIVQTSNAYGSTMKVRVVDVQDLRSVSNLPSGSYVATDHGSLSGRTAAGSHPASAISNTPAGTIAATDVQAAIDELDTEKQAALGFTPENVANKSTDGTLVANSATLYPSQSAVKTYADTKAPIASPSFTGSVSVNATDLFVDSVNHRVGIGTASPATELEIVTNDTSPTLRLYRTGTFSGTDQVGSLSFGYAGDSLASVTVFRDGANDAGALTLGTQSTGGGITERLRIGSSGLVTAPGVYSNTDASAANVYVDSSGNLKRSTASGGGGSGTVNSSVAGHVAVYPSTGTTVEGLADLTAIAGSLIIKDTTSIGSVDLSAISGNSAAGRVARIMVNSASSSGSGGGGDAYLTLSSDLPSGSSTTNYVLGIDVTDDSALVLGAGSGVPGNVNLLRFDRASGQMDVKGTGSAGVPRLVLAGDTNTGIWAPAADTWAVSTNGTERLRIKSDGKVGINRTPANYRCEILEADANTNITQYPLALIGSTTGTAAAGLGTGLIFVGKSSDGSHYDNLYIEANQSAVGSGSQSVDFVIKSRKAGSFTTRFTIFGATSYVQAIGVYQQTTASAANVYVDSSGNIMRSTSSLRYKTAIAEVAQDEAAKLLDLTPVTYASLCEGDNKEERHYGFIAEELDLLDPVLVNYKTLEDGTKVADGVQYERVVVGLLKLVQDLTKRVADLEAKQA